MATGAKQNPRVVRRVIIVAAVVVVALCGGAFAFDRYALSSTYARVPDRQASLLPTYDLYKSTHPRTDEQFQLDGYTLRGHVYGMKNTRGLVIFRHGIFSKHDDYLPLITALVDKGWRVFAYDAIGCGASDGDTVFGMSQSPFDVAAAIDYARDKGLADGMPIALWGHSWGGYGVATALSLRSDDVKACISMSGYDTPMKILSSSATGSYGLLGQMQYPFLWLNTYIDFGQNANLSASESIVGSGVPTLVIQGSHDTTVPLEDVSILGTLQQRETQPGEGAGVYKLAEADVTLVVKSDEGRNGHSSYFYSPKSQAYLNSCASHLRDLIDQNDDDTGADEVQEYLKTVDMLAANTADPELIETIDAFLARNLG